MTKDDFLAHHGILGMKWGVRRYQNEDGTLTAAGKARYAKVAGDEKLRAKETKRAIEIATETAGVNRYAAQVHQKAAERSRSRHKFKKSEQYEMKAKEFLKEAALMDKRVKDIQSGNIRAGRDFILQRDYYLRPAGLFIGGGLLKNVRATSGKRIGAAPLLGVEAETTFIDRKRK